MVAPATVWLKPREGLTPLWAVQLSPPPLRLPRTREQQQKERRRGKSRAEPSAKLNVFPCFCFRRDIRSSLSTMPWRIREAIVSCTNKFVDVPLCRARSAQPPRRAPPEPNRLWCVRVLNSTSIDTQKTSIHWSAARKEERFSYGW